METGNDSAGNGHEEQGDDRRMFAAEFCRLKCFRFLKQCRIVEAQPQQHDQDSSRTHQQHRGKEGIDRADDLIHGEECGNHVVHKNRSHTDPEVVVSGQQTVTEIGGNVDKHCYDQQKQNDHKPGEDAGISFTEIVMDDLGQVCAFVPQGHHPCQKVVGCTGDHAADRDDQENDLAELDTEDDPDHGTDTGDVQQLDHHVFPFGQDHIVHAVRFGNGGRDAVIRSDNFFNQFSVGKVTYDQQHDPCKKE